MTADTGADDDDAPGDGSAADPSDRAGTDDSEPAADAASDASTAERRSEVDPADVAALAEALDGLDGDVSDLASELEDLETRIDEKTVHRDDIRSELRRYVRKRQRRGHATGWGPYLVLLYGTAMTVAAFFYLGDLWAIVAMLVIWLSTLGLYVFMLVLGAFLGVGRRLAGLRDLAGKLR
mgnify:CR=1 FL=1